MFGRAAIRLGIGPHSSLFFFLLFFPRLISAVEEWMSIILYTWCGPSANLENAGLKCVACSSLEIQDAKMTQKNRHLHTIAQLCRAIS